MQVIQTAAALMVRSMVLSAQSAGQQRLSLLERSVAAGEEAGELARLRDENRRLTSELRMLKGRFGHAPVRKRYSPLQRLQILWHMEYYRIPRSRVKEHFLIAKSTLYRWLHAAQEGDLGERKGKMESPRKTPREMAEMIWETFEANPQFGRKRIANILWLLEVFVAASTVRNVLLRPKPKAAPAGAKANAVPARPRQIVARYSNHVWSVDRTRVLRWGLWPTWVLVAIDHYSRAVMAVGVKWLWDTSERLAILPSTSVDSTIWDRKERYEPTPTGSGTPDLGTGLSCGKAELELRSPSAVTTSICALHGL